MQYDQRPAAAFDEYERAIDAAFDKYERNMDAAIDEYARNVKRSINTVFNRVIWILAIVCCLLLIAVTLLISTHP